MLYQSKANNFRLLIPFWGNHVELFDILIKIILLFGLLADLIWPIVNRIWFTIYADFLDLIHHQIESSKPLFAQASK